ncbi:8027_t:CDS:2, partial [Racocetra persica]
EHEELYEESTTTNQSKGHPKSFVWNYFDKDNNSITAICKVILDNRKKCGISYNDSSTTSNLINHLALECKSFQKLLHSLDENFSISYNKTIKTSVNKSFSWSKEQLTSLIEKESVAMSMMMDFWTSHLNQRYIGITCEVIAELIPCAAHVLQLSVGKGLNMIRHLVLRIKRLIDFFNNSPKQTEYLLTTQRDLGFKKSIVYLPSQLQSDESVPVRKNGKRLARIMLSDDEWIFLDELNDILCGFEEITTLLSGNTYITISLIYPAISIL